MAQRFGRRAAAVALALATIVVISAPVHGALPLLAGLGKQIVKDMLIDGIKSQLIGSLAESGCKGAAIASLISGAPSRGLGGLLGGSTAPALPTGMATPAGAMINLGDAAAERVAPGGAVARMPAGIDPRAIDPGQMAALMQQQMRMGGMPAMSSEQIAQMQSALAAMQQAMAQPLSPAETKAVFDELASLGVMTPDMQAQAGDCLALAGPAANPGLGTTAALMKSMVLPKLREAREQLANLTPEQREQLASEIAQAMREASPEDREAFKDGFGVGFFPSDVVESVRSKLR